MQSYSATLAQSAEIWLLPAAILLGLLVGSFLNVVITRLPVMMEHAWQDACADIHGQHAPVRERFDLAWPRSHCPSCRHVLSWRELFPVLSWLWQRGRCRHCAAPVSWQYPLVELATSALFLACALQFGLSFSALAGMALCAALVALAAIDARTMLLPDSINQPLLWAGLLLSLSPYGFVPIADATLGAAVGYGALWLVATVFRLATGKEGMGQGDWKLLAALGAWFGWQALPGIILMASLAGVLVSLVLIVARRATRDQAIPFGPYLAAAGIVTLFRAGLVA